MERFLTGWPLWWRSHLLPLAMALALRGSDEISKIALGAALVTMILLVHWAGKTILQNRFRQTVPGFVGWSIFWRSTACLMGWMLLIAGLYFFTVWVFRFYDLGDDPWFLGMVLVGLFLWADINSLGWAIEQTRFKLGRPLLRG